MTAVSLFVFFNSASYSLAQVSDCVSCGVLLPFGIFEIRSRTRLALNRSLCFCFESLTDFNTASTFIFTMPLLLDMVPVFAATSVFVRPMLLASSNFAFL